MAEALAAGVPVVATAVDGVPELLDHGRAGVLVPADDVAALTDAVGALIVDETRRAALGAAALRRSRELGVDRVGADYRRVYAELIDESRTGRRPRAMSPPIHEHAGDD